jgi:hypothetical protein
MLLVREAHGITRIQVPAQTESRVVRELFGGGRALVGRADLAVPGIPPAADLRRTVGNVGVDEGVADSAGDIWSEWPVDEIEIAPDEWCELLDFAPGVEGQARRRGGLESQVLVRAEPVEAETHLETIAEPIGTEQREADIAVEADFRPAIELDVVAVQVDQVGTEFPACLA